MADDLTITTTGGEVPVLTDEIASRNGGTQTDGAHAQVIKLAIGGDGVADDASDTHPVPVRDGGVFDYTSSTGPTTFRVPPGARLRRVAVIPGTAGATVQIGTGKPTIVVPADGDFDEDIPGLCIGPVITIDGEVITYYISWVA